MAYAELGSDYVDRQQVERRRLVERLEGLGVKVTIAEVAEEAGAAYLQSGPVYTSCTPESHLGILQGK